MRSNEIVVFAGDKHGWNKALFHVGNGGDLFDIKARLLLDGAAQHANGNGNYQVGHIESSILGAFDNFFKQGG